MAEDAGQFNAAVGVLRPFLEPLEPQLLGVLSLLMSAVLDQICRGRLHCQSASGVQLSEFAESEPSISLSVKHKCC